MEPTWDALAARLGKDTRQISRWRKIPGAPEAPDYEAWTEWLNDRSAPPVDPTGLPGVCEYDAAVKAGRIDYSKAHKREQVVEQAIVNAIKREELKKIKADTLSKDDVEKKIRIVTTAALDALSILPDLVAEASPVGDRPAMRQRAREWVDVIRTKMAEKIRLA